MPPAPIAREDVVDVHRVGAKGIEIRRCSGNEITATLAKNEGTYRLVGCGDVVAERIKPKRIE